MQRMTGQETGGRVPVFECVRQSWGFFLSSWREFLLAAAITGALSQLGVVLTLVQARAPEEQTMLGVTLLDLAAGAPALLASLMFTACVLRKVLHNEFRSPTGLSFGADELRLLGVTAALICIILPFLLLLFLVLTVAVLGRLADTPDQLNALLEDPEALSAALQTTLGPGGVAAFVLFVVIVFGAIIYTSVRLLMANAATIGERRMIVFQSWSWSRGNVTRVLAAAVLTALPVFLFESFLDGLRQSLLAGGLSGPGAIVMLNAVLAFLMSLASIPTITLGALLYKGLRPAEFVPK